MKTIILIHGFRGTHHGLALITKALSGYHTVVPDLPGFGEGESLEAYDLPHYTAWLGRFIKSQDLPEPPILLGHSFGSIICAAYAAEHPNLVEKLVLVNPIGAPALSGPRGLMTKLAIFYYALGRKLPAKLAGPWLKSKAVVMIMSLTMAKTSDRELRRYIHHEHLQHFSDFHSANSVSAGFLTSVSHSVRDFAPNISVPTLLIAGDKDDITPVAKQFELQQLFKNAELAVIPGVGHLTHYETPKAVATLTKTFLARK